MRGKQLDSQEQCFTSKMEKKKSMIATKEVLSLLHHLLLV